MIRNRASRLAVAAATVVVAASFASAAPLFRVDIKSDNIAENGTPDGGYPAVEGGMGDGTNGPQSTPTFEGWFINGGVSLDGNDPRFQSPVFDSTATPGMRVTLAAGPAATELVDSIRRFNMPNEFSSTPPGPANWYFNNLYRDFAQLTRNDETVLTTMDITIEDTAGTTLQPNTAYNVTFFAYDKFFDAGGNHNQTTGVNANDTNIRNTTMHFTDRTTGGLNSTSDSYMFSRVGGYENSLPGSALNSLVFDNYTWSCTMTVFTDAQGRMTFQEVAQPGPPGGPGGASQISPFLNGFEVTNDVIQWTGGAAGNWGDGSSWTGGMIPNASSAVANFFSPDSATVNVEAPKTAANLNFNGAGAFTINGNAITMDSFKGPNSSVGIAVRRGSHTVNADLNVNDRMYVNVASGAAVTLAGAVNVGTNAISLQKDGGGVAAFKSASFPSVRINFGTLRTTGATTSVATLTIGTVSGALQGALDITNTSWIVNYTDASPFTTIRDNIIAGRAGGSWNANGINSSTAAANASITGIGYAEASDLGIGTFGGVVVDATSVVFRYTRLGDANLDGITNINDFSLLGANFNQAGGWNRGDFNYDGNVNIGDFSLLAANFNQAAPSADAARVPEPAHLTMLAAAAFAALRRRGRQALPAEVLD